MYLAILALNKIILSNISSCKLLELFLITQPEVFILTAITHIAKINQYFNLFNTPTSRMNVREKNKGSYKYFLTNQNLLCDFQQIQFLHWFKPLWQYIRGPDLTQQSKGTGPCYQWLQRDAKWSETSSRLQRDIKWLLSSHSRNLKVMANDH